MLRFARLYVAPNKPLIVASGLDVSGVQCENDDPRIVQDAENAKEVVAAIRLALADFGSSNRDLRHVKKTDWPAFIASGCKSVDDFERQYSLITISAINDAELFYEASVLPDGEANISLHITLNRYADDLEWANQLMRLYKSARTWYISIGSNL